MTVRNPDGSLACICHEHRAVCGCAPQPAPATPLQPEQRRFLALHARHLVTSWRWFMQESQMRAETDRGVTSTISRASLVELVHRGLVAFSHGNAMALTDAGRAVAEQREAR